MAIGLQYNVHRWYDPTLGRWISEDPIGFGGGHANLAAYAGNSPTNRVDSMGLAPVDPLPRPVEPTWRPIRIFADGAIGPFSIGAQLSDGFELVPDIDVPFILQNLADLDQLGPAQGQLGFEAPWGAGGVSLSDSGLEGALELDFEHVDVSLTALGEIFNVSFVGDQTIVTVSSSGPNVNVQGLLLLGDYGGLGFSADGSGFMGQVQLEGPLGTIGGIFGNQGSGIIVTVPINQGPGPLNFDGWLEGNLNLNFGTGSFPPAGLSLPGFIPGNPNSWMPSGGTTVEVNVELQPRPRGRR